MSEEKFTKGPWTVDRHSNLVSSSGKRVVAYGLHCSMAMASPSEEERANTTLMEAAPELYEALTHLLARAQPHLSPFDPTELKAVNKAQMALAKAVGRA